MYQQIRLSDRKLLGEPGPLPDFLIGLDDASVADLSWVGAPLAKDYGKTGYAVVPDPEPEPEPAPLPDGPTLSDWRVALVRMGKLDDVIAKVTAARDSGSLDGAIAYQRLEYANNVYRAELMAYREAFGFTEDEVAQSLALAVQIGEAARRAGEGV